MKFSYHWLQTYFEKELPEPAKLAELLTMHIFEVEGVEEIKNADGAISDYALDVKILPDRAGYAYAHANLAREINAFTNAGLKNKLWPEIHGDTIAADLNDAMPKINIVDAQKVPIFTMRLVSGIENNASPEWLRTALEAVGQRSISLIVDLTNYVMLDTGQPMHAFDADKVKGDIDIRFAKDGEKVTLLDGREVALDPSILVIADTEGALDIAGIKGGKKAEVGASTKNILITAGNFNSSYIRKTSQKVGIKNDSTKRYENAVTYERVFDAQNEFITLLQKEQPGITVSNLFCEDAGVEESARKNRVIKTTAAFISQKIGMDVGVDEVVQILKLLEIDATQEGGEIVIVAPMYRADLKVAEDIVEEVARLKGINSMPEVVPQKDIAVPALRSFFYSNIARDVLLSLGFSEVYTHTLIEEGDYALANPLTSERSHLRNTLADGLKQALCFNVQNIDVLGSEIAIATDIRIFDIGHVFKDKKETWSLSLGVASKTGKQAKEKNKTALQDAVDDLAKIFNLENADVFDVKSIEGETEAIGGAAPVAYAVAEINFEKVLAVLPVPEEFATANPELCAFSNMPAFVDMQSASRFKRFSQYPYIVRDIAVFIPGATGRASELRDLINSVNSPLIVRLRKFDEFEKKNKETGEVEKTSYAFRMVFQSMERTLTESEVQVVMDEVLKKIGEKEGWEVR